MRHLPVLVTEVLTALQLQPGDTVIDATLGLGGHAALILDRIGSNGRLLGLERSDEGLVEARRRLASYDSRATLVHADFRDLGRVAAEHDFADVNAILFDLGLASWQIDTGHKGVSFQIDAALDMRLGPYEPTDFTRKEDDPSGWVHSTGSGRAGNAALARTVRTWRFQPAAEFLGSGSEEELSNAFRALGDVQSPKALARRIGAARQSQSIERTSHLVKAVGTTDPARLAPIFGALRILVNDEYGALVAGIHDAWELLAPRGNLAIITFHSGEDRIVKTELRHLAGASRLTTVKPLVDEMRHNPRSRSATLRTIHKIANLQSNGGT